MTETILRILTNNPMNYFTQKHYFKHWTKFYTTRQLDNKQDPIYNQWPTPNPIGHVFLHAFYIKSKVGSRVHSQVKVNIEKQLNGDKVKHDWMSA